MLFRQFLKDAEGGAAPFLALSLIPLMGFTGAAVDYSRANAVKDALVRNGVPATAIAVVGRGEQGLLVPTPDGVREPQNRRVEIVLQ